MQDFSNFQPANLLTKIKSCASKEEKNIFLEESYILNRYYMWMTGVYDRHGNQCSMIYETKRILFVEQSPLEILDYSIRCIGFDLKGALKTAKHLLGKSSKLPVVVNPLYEIVAFPTHSPAHPDNIWFNPDHIRRTTKSLQENKTNVTFSNSTTLTVPNRLSSFNTQILAAEQLKRMVLEAARTSTCILLN